MLEVYDKGMLAAFEKVGINLETARKALSRQKDSLIRRKVYRNEKGEAGFEKMDDNTYYGPVTLWPEIKTYAKGDTLTALDSHEKKPNFGRGMNSGQREMFNRMMLLHESLERKGAKNTKGLNFAGGHTEPEVIFSENNMVATLPEEMSNVGDAYRRLRSQDIAVEQVRKAFPEFSFGDKRYSRHKIREMSDQIRAGISKVVQRKE